MSEIPHISHVKLSGYKSIKGVDCDLKPGLNIIIGKNGSGKTNFLRFLQIVLKFQFFKLKMFRAEIEFKGENLKDNKNHVRLKISQGLKSQLGEPSMIDGSDFYELITQFFDADNYSPNAEEKEQVRRMTRSWLVKSKDVFVSHGYPRDYEGVAVQLKMEIDKAKGPFTDDQYLDEYLRLFSLGESFTLALYNWLYAQVKYHKADRLDFSEFECLRFLKERLPLCSSVCDVKFNENYILDNKSRKEKTLISQVFLKFKIDEDWHEYEDLSDGTKRLIYILLELSNSQVVINNGTTMEVKNEHKGGLYIIEEPELGIHPHQLHSLMQIIKEESKNKNIIISTHSPSVLDHLNSDELDRILICSYEQGKGTQLRNLSAEQIETANSYMQEESLYLSDYWRYSDLEN